MKKREEKQKKNENNNRTFVLFSINESKLNCALKCSLIIYLNIKWERERERENIYVCMYAYIDLTVNSNE